MEERQDRREETACKWSVHCRAAAFGSETVDIRVEDRGPFLAFSRVEADDIVGHLEQFRQRGIVDGNQASRKLKDKGD